MSKQNEDLDFCLLPVDLNKHIAEVRQIIDSKGVLGLVDPQKRLYGVIIAPNPLVNYYFIRPLPEYGIKKDFYCEGLTVLSNGKTVSFILRHFESFYADCIFLVINGR